MSGGLSRPLEVVDVNEHGLASAFVRPRDAAHLAQAFDPAGGCVVIEHHYPSGSDWHRLAVPVPSAAEGAEPELIRNLEFDVAFSVQRLLDLAPEWKGPLSAWQCREQDPPKASLAREDRGRALVARMRGVGIDLLVEWPGRGDIAMIASHEVGVVEAAIVRLRA